MKTEEYINILLKEKESLKALCAENAKKISVLKREVWKLNSKIATKDLKLKEIENVPTNIMNTQKELELEKIYNSKLQKELELEKANNSKLQNELNEANSYIIKLKTQIDVAKKPEKIKKEVNKLKRDLNKLKAEYDTLQYKYDVVEFENMELNSIFEELERMCDSD